MGQISPYLRKAVNGHSHWCPGCEGMHLIPDTWTFDGKADLPTFSPSVKITGKQRVVVNGEWTGGWVRDAEGKAVDYCCHYVLTAGQLNFCTDSTHALAGKTVPLPELPKYLKD